MSDLNIRWDTATAQGEWATIDDALYGADDLVTAILISIFSDRLAHEDDTIPDGSTNRRGCWSDDPNNLMGSRIWLLSRAKQDAETLSAAYGYILESVKWLLDDGVVAKFDVAVQWVRASTLGAQIVAYKNDGSVNRTVNFSWVWDGIP